MTLIFVGRSAGCSQHEVFWAKRKISAYQWGLSLGPEWH